jgi:hypothetical protein
MLERDSIVFHARKNDTKEHLEYINSIDETVKEDIAVNMSSYLLRRDKVKSYRSGFYSAFGRRILSDNPR